MRKININKLIAFNSDNTACNYHDHFFNQHTDYGIVGKAVRHFSSEKLSLSLWHRGIFGISRAIKEKVHE